MNYKSIIISIALSAACLPAGAQKGAQVQKHVEPLVTTKIGLLTRTYGDSVVLRWSAEDFASSEEEEDLDPDAGKSQQQVIDELTGQLSLFPDDEDA